jgi:hypothetical protein
MTAAILLNTLQRLTHRRGGRIANPQVFGEKIGLLTSILGCWHEDVGRPFVEGKTAYRACVKCGARKQFDPETLQTFGDFYCAPATRF